MKSTKFNKMVIDQESATFAAFITSFLNIKFSDFVPEKFVVYTFDPESENSQVEETLLVQFDEKNRLSTRNTRRPARRSFPAPRPRADRSHRIPTDTRRRSR